MKKLFLLSILSSMAFPQAIQKSYTFVIPNVPPGNYSGNAAAGAVVSINTTTYTDVTATSACPPSQPVVLVGTSICTSVADTSGNLAFWVLPNANPYSFTMKIAAGQTLGPFSFTPGGSSNPVFPPTIFVTTVSGLPSAAANRNVVYLVINGSTSSDCTIGGGTNQVWCGSNGTIWASIGGSSGGSGSGIQIATPTNVSANALQGGTGFSLSVGTVVNVRTTALTQATTSTTVTITLNATTYTILNYGSGPTAGIINTGTQYMLLSLETTTALWLNGPQPFDATMQCSATYPFPCGVAPNQFVTTTGTSTVSGNIDAHTGAVRPPEATIPLPSAAANTGYVYIVLNGANSSDCTGGGGTTIVTSCRSNGTTWLYTGGAGSGPSAGNNITVNGSTVSFNPLDVTTIWWDEPWIGGPILSSSTSNASSTKWYLFGNNNFPALSFVSVDANHQTAMQSTFGDTGGADLEYVASFGTYLAGATANWTLVGVLKTSSSATNVSYLGGLGFASAGSCRYNVDSNCIAIGYFPATSANWLLITCAGSATCANQDTGVAYANSTWFKFTLSSTSSGTIKGQVNAGSVVSSSTDVPTSAYPVVPWAVVSTAGLTSYNWLVNKTAYLQTGATRP